MEVAVQGPTTTRSDKRPWRAARVAGIGLAVVVVVAIVGLNLWVRLSPPLSPGSVVAWLGETKICDQTEFDGEPTLECREVPFAEGAGVGIGFTLRNSAPIAMTIVAVGSLEPPVATPAYLHPELTAEDGVFGLDAGRPFAPIDVAPNSEVALQLVGTYLDCDQVASWYMPGSALVIDHASVTVRWAFAETDVDVPLRGVLSLPAPDSCPGS